MKHFEITYRMAMWLFKIYAPENMTYTTWREDNPDTPRTMFMHEVDSDNNMQKAFHKDVEDWFASHTAEDQFRMAEVWYDHCDNECTRWADEAGCGVELLCAIDKTIQEQQQQ